MISHRPSVDRVYTETAPDHHNHRQSTNFRTLTEISNWTLNPRPLASSDDTVPHSPRHFTPFEPTLNRLSRFHSIPRFHLSSEIARFHSRNCCRQRHNNCRLNQTTTPNLLTLTPKLAHESAPQPQLSIARSRIFRYS